MNRRVEHQKSCSFSKGMSQAQLMSWNNDGYILIPNFLNEEDCDAMDESIENNQ